MNGSQLHSTNLAVNSLNTRVDGVDARVTNVDNRVTAVDNRVTVVDARVTQLDSIAVKYDVNTDGTVNYSSVTLGTPASPVGIHNVANGVADSDLINLGQVRAIAKESSSGIAAAMASNIIPQAIDPNKTMFGFGVASFNGESAIAAGASVVSDNGLMTFKASVAAGTNKNVGVSFSAGFNF